MLFFLVKGKDTFFIKFYNTTSNDFISQFFKEYNLKEKRSLHFEEQLFFMDPLERLNHAIFPFFER